MSGPAAFLFLAFTAAPSRASGDLANMFVHRYGTGKRVFFGLHGWGGTHRTFEPLVEHLPTDASLYAADLPGYGQSAAPREWSVESIGGEVAESLGEAGAARLTVVGNCSGAIFGLLAAEELARRGEFHRIERIVLIDPFAYVPWYFKLFVEKSWGRLAYHSTFANPVGRWLTNVSLHNRRAADSDLTESFKAINHDTSYRYLTLLAGIESVTRFANLPARVDIIYGERTFGAVKDSIHLWRRMWPHARCHQLPGVGHLPIEEAGAPLSAILFGPRQGQDQSVSVLCQTS